MYSIFNIMCIVSLQEQGLMSTCFAIIGDPTYGATSS